MFTGACTSQVGTQMQIAAQSWTVLELSKNNSVYLGIDQSLGVIPIVLFTLLAGVLADRRDRRTLILSSQSTQMTCAPGGSVCSSVTVAARPDAQARPCAATSAAASAISKAARVGLFVREYS